jgi:hypothetical protein
MPKHRAMVTFWGHRGKFPSILDLVLRLSAISLKCLSLNSGSHWVGDAWASVGLDTVVIRTIAPSQESTNNLDDAVLGCNAMWTCR